MSEITWSFYDLPLPQFQAYALRCGELTQISVRTAGKDGTVTLERWEIPRLMEQNRGKLWENIWENYGENHLQMFGTSDCCGFFIRRV